MLKKIFLIVIFIFVNGAGYLISQELDPTIDVNMDKLNVDVRDRLSNFKQDIQNYLSKTKFTDEVIVNDIRSQPYKIKCTFQFIFQTATSYESYQAQVLVSIQRYVFRVPNSYTTLLRVLDEKWDFNYVKGQTFYRDDLKFNSLTSFLDYYAFMIVGLDDDTWEEQLGSDRYRKAQNIVNLAIASGSFSGWMDNSITKPSRNAFVQEMLNPKYNNFRKALWMYHFSGIDSIQFNKRQALTRIAEAVELIGSVKKTEVRSFMIKAFFDTKYLEIAQTLVDYYDKTIYRRLAEIDPDHSSTYEDYSTK
jgi:hypothetical protein